ncbi:MAG: hypothetical protein ABJF04_24100 [Reichenbachiella sp.]|uniref:hypothetical protein n=1 Tax=Reichenbachiella sp. TaxID=2184521 RepID=UPI0032670A12
MKTKLFSTLLIYVAFLLTAHAQSGVATTAINGDYQLLEAERSAQGPTKIKKMEYGEVNGQKMLAALGCEKGCIPAVYSYQEEASKQLGIPVFFNSYGLYMITYDEDSFVSCAPGTPLGKAVWDKFSYVNFYSKDDKKVADMTKQKATEYAIAISKRMAEK